MKMMTSAVVATVAVVALLVVVGVEGRVSLTRHHQSLAATKTLSLKLATPDNKEVHLMLTKDTKQESSLSNVPTYIRDSRGKIVRWQEPEGYSLEKYIDAETQASVVVEKRQDSAGRTVERYRGSFVDGNQVYWLAPVMTRSSSVEKSDRFQPLEGSITVSIGDVDHFVAPAKADSSNEYDSIISSAKLHEKSHSERRYEERDRKIYVVELMIACDYSLYRFWYKTYASFTDPVLKEYEATLLLRHYFAGVSDQINQRYKSMNQPDFEIQVKLVGFFFAKTVADSPYTEESDVKTTFEDVDFVQMDLCLKKFGKWIRENSQFYGSFDHAVLFVGNYLYDKFENGVPSTKSGLSNVGGVCQVSQGLCTSINYERGFYSTCQTGAHELGHNLGAAHDEENNECKGLDQYIMASAPGVLNHDNYLHPYTFSPCSIRYFRDFLAKLNSQGNNCLLSFNSATQVVLDFQLPGIIQDVDQQCFSYMGRNSFYCAGMQNDENLCEKIICWDPEEEKCVWESVEHRAYAGTPCGNKKWCLMGACTADAKAPEMNDTCTYGDYKGNMFISKEHPLVSCKDMIAQFPEQCYSADKQKSCCKSCPTIRNDAKPDCEYGDRTPARCLAGERINCYDDNFNRDCCDWCEKQMGTDKKCRFGDKADWCSKITNDQCYSDHEKCCESCQKFHTNVKGCEYGDTVPWCASQELDASACRPSSDMGQKCCGSCAAKFPNGISPNAEQPSHGQHPAGGTAKCPQGDLADYCLQLKDHREQCYTSEDVCCATCEQLSSNIAGCKYGDRMEGCEDQVDSYYCQDPSIRELCCKTCSKFKKRQSSSLVEKLLKKLD
jgi:hypothetical protein